MHNLTVERRPDGTIALVFDPRAVAIGPSKSGKTVHIAASDGAIVLDSDTKFKVQCYAFRAPTLAEAEKWGLNPALAID